MALEFQPERWKGERGNRAFDNPRAALAVGALEVLQEGMSEPEILELLGEPDAGQEGNRWIYRIGALGFGVDLSFLVIEFDTDGKLARRYIDQG